jgi:hypothetical protein
MGGPLGQIFDAFADSLFWRESTTQRRAFRTICPGRQIGKLPAHRWYRRCSGVIAAGDGRFKRNNPIAFCQNPIVMPGGYC